MIKGLVALALSLAIVFPSALEAERAHAATCSVSGGQSGRLKYSGQLTQISATVCGNQIWNIIGNPTKPKKPTKPVKNYKPRKYANNFTVIPDKPRIRGLANLLVGETSQFESLAVRHTRNRLLFWYPSQVRFKPITFAWNFGDSTPPQTNSVASHSWKVKGTYIVRLVVGFSVKYRIIGHSGWVPMSGLVFSSSAPLTVRVGAVQVETTSKVKLVHWHCLQKPSAIGC